MAKRPTVTTITGQYASVGQLNTNFNNIKNSFDNTLSRDGSTPNQMEADIDLNENDLLNVKNLDAKAISADQLIINGQAVVYTNVDTTTNISPMDFGAVGDGVADDGIPINLALSALRAAVNTSFWIGSTVSFDGQNRTYATTLSLDAAEISGVSWGIKNARFIGKCTGKAVLDTTGSRGYHMSDINIWGDQTNTPSIGWEAGRSTAGGHFGFCDLNLIERLTIDGYFSTASEHLYGQESTTYLACKFWNKSPSGQAGIVSGYDTPAYSSDYTTPVTGGRSNIDNRFIGCEWRYLPPAGAQATVTGISNANPAVVTCSAGHSFVNGNEVCLSALSSMTTLNSLRGVIQNVTATTFEIVGLDTTALGAFSGSGLVTKAQTAATLAMSRLSNTRFIGCYIQSFGMPAIGFSWPDTSVPHGIDIEGLLVEGAPSSYMHFTQGNTNKSIEGFRFSTPQNLAGIAVFTLDAGSSGSVALGNGVIRVDHDNYGTRKLILDAQAAKFSLPGMDVTMPTINAINKVGLAVARGSYYGYDSTVVWHMGSYMRDPVIYGGTFTYTGGNAWTVVEADGAFRPLTTATFDIGSATYRVATLYATSINTSSNVTMTGLPTSDPGVTGRLWIDVGAGRVLKVSA